MLQPKINLFKESKDSGDTKYLPPIPLWIPNITHTGNSPTINNIPILIPPPPPIAQQAMQPPLPIPLAQNNKPKISQPTPQRIYWPDKTLLDAIHREYDNISSNSQHQ